MTITLIIGASSLIAKRLRDNLLSQGHPVVAISRQAADVKHTQLHWIECDQTPDAIDRACKEIENLTQPISRVCIFTAVLHSEAFMPEKRLEDVNFEQLALSFQINTNLPLLWLSKLIPQLNNMQHRSLSKISIAVLSARVGSIEDNRLGGWYSYRASKAALNMALKTAAIELARRFPNIKLIAFHPGTTDTQLSQPFQARVDPKKLFTPDFVAERLLTIMNNTPVDGQLSYLDWDNKPIPW
jgi:NAD(P)-dependent dehydrogenase (short-subunit alcohol dehydrogenase family)